AADAQETLDEADADAAVAAAQGWAALDNSPAAQYQLALAQDADAYTYNVAPLKDGLVHTEDQASHDETVNDDAADVLEQGQIADAQMTESTATAQADAALGTSVAQAQQWRSDHDAAAWQSNQDSNCVIAGTFTAQTASCAQGQADSLSDAWKTYRDSVADISLTLAQLGLPGYLNYQQDLNAASTTLQNRVALANNLFSHPLIGEQQWLADNRAMIGENLQTAYDSDAAGYSNKVETADGVAEKAIAAAQAAQDMANVAASGTDLTTQAADLAAAVAQIAPADKSYWDSQAGFQEQEDVSDAGAAQTRDTTELTAYDSQVHAWAAALNTPWATEQAAFVDADVAWQENVDGAEVTDVTQTDDAQVAWTSGVDTADVTQETGDAGALGTAAAAEATAQTAAADAVDNPQSGLPYQQGLASDATTTYDDAVVTAAQTEADGEATQQYTLQTAVNDAYFTYLGAVADAQLAVANGTETPAQAATDIANAQATQNQTVSGAWVNWAEKVAGLQTTEVSDVGTAKNAWQTSEATVENAAVGIIGDAASGLTGGLANAAAGLVSGLATDEGNWESAVAGAGSTLTSGMMAADQTLTHSEATADQGDELGYVDAEVAYDETTVGAWASAIEGNYNPYNPPYADAGAAAWNLYHFEEYESNVAEAEAQQVSDDDQALESDAQKLTDADVTQSDEQEKALVNLADGVSAAAAAEVQTTAPEEAAAIGTAATDTAGAVGGYAQAQDAFIKAAAAALTGDDTATVKANVTYDNSVAGDAQTYVENVAPAAATLWLAGYTPAAWAAYNQVVQTQAANQQSSDKTANVTRVGQVGTAEVAEAGGLGTAQSTLATAAGTTETGLVGQLVSNDNSLAGEEASADEGFNGTLGGDLASFLKGMAQADVDWATNAGAPIEDYQQTLGNDEVQAAGQIASAEGTPFVADAKAVAQDDANYQDALVDDAVQEAAAEASAEMADGTAVSTELSAVATADDQYAENLTANLGSDAVNTAAADATQYTSLASVQAAYTTAAAQADADHQNWLAQNVGQPGYPPAGAAVPPDPQPHELADAQLTLAQGQADANLAWVKSKDAADEGFAMTDATEWASMADGEAKAESAYNTADTAAAAGYETGVAEAQAEQNTADSEAAIAQTDDDATADADWQGNAAAAVADGTQQAIVAEEQATGVGTGAWTLYEDDQLATNAKDTAYAATEQAAYINQAGQNETAYLNTDLSDYLTEINTILGDDFSGGSSAAAAAAANDLAQSNTTVGDEVTFEQTLAPDAQAYQDTVAQDAHDAQWAEAQAAHDLAVGTIDASTYAAQMSAAEGTQTADDDAAAALYQSQVGGATVTQVETDADAALTDATLDAGAVKSASDADALAVQKYTKQESAAYEAETEEDASALEAEQVNVAQQENHLAGLWNVNAVVYEDGNEVEGVPAPWGTLMQQLAQANLNLVAGGTNADGSPYEGTAVAQQNLTDQQAEAQFTDEQSDADAQYTRDLAADLDQYNLSIAQAQATHDAQYALAASDAALVAAGAFPADLPGTSTAPDDGTPITASGNYSTLETIGGYQMGPTTATSTSLVGSMFSVGPNMGVPYAGWTGWPGWSGADAPPNPGPPASNSGGPPGGTWSSNGAPPEAPQILGFI
ncbi:MAG: hypothetical protein ACREHD_15760, partial [Pirellulales bacterium]